MSSAPQLYVEATCQFDSKVVRGVAADLLPPKWFTKNPDTTFEEDDLPQMLRVIRHAADNAIQAPFASSFFDWWRLNYQEQMDWAENQHVPKLLAGFGFSLVERAVLDAFCRWQATPLHRVLRQNRLELNLGAIRPNLRGVQPRDFLPADPQTSLALRHTVGLGDPLSDDEIDDNQLLDDGLPQSLAANIRRYGLKYFKIKLQGEIQADKARLIQLANMIERDIGADARITVDANENYRDIESFRSHWESHCAEPCLKKFFERSLLMVEQPIHRDQALRQSVGAELAAWDTAPPIIIDESDADLDSTPTALELGYSGTSHKNCKGIVKGLANAASIALARNAGEKVLLSAEDLANFGPVALLQDLAMASLLGVTHVERNGHHYFAGLQCLPDSEQQKIIRNHSDLFAINEKGFASLAPSNGQLQMASVNAAAFGPTEQPNLDWLERLK